MNGELVSCLSRRSSEKSKIQIPNPKKAPNLKSQTIRDAFAIIQVLGFGIWDLSQALPANETRRSNLASLHRLPGSLLPAFRHGVGGVCAEPAARPPASAGGPPFRQS